MSADENDMVLIVDDSPLNLQVLGNILQAHGFQPAVAKNGIEALDFIKEQKPQLILLDVMMPDMDGFETCQRIKEDETSQDIPIIFITALSEISDKLKAFEAGGVDYITKPFMKDEVIARINVHIKLKKAQEKLADMSVKDEMTGVYNRRFAFETLNRKMKLAQREKSGFLICFIDVDNLKKINDQYGHSEGDLLIKSVVASINDIIRSTDYLFRMGGDEFMILFQKAKLKDSDFVLQRVREELNKQQLHGLPIDFSYGFSEFHHDDAISAYELVNMADSKMYEDKLKKKQNHH